MRIDKKFKDEILKQFNRRVAKSVTQREAWLQTEVIDNYSVYEGGAGLYGDTFRYGQWTQNDFEYQRKRDMPIAEVNRVSPVIRAISGFEIQNRREVTFSAKRTTSEDADDFSRISGHGYRWIMNDAGVEYENSRAAKDSLICGVGFVHSRIAYERNLNGDVEVCRVFPGFVFWDSAARAKNLKDSNWISVVSVRDKSAEGMGEDEEGDNAEVGVSTLGSADEQVLRFFSYTNVADSDLLVEHDYQWRQKEPVVRIKNPIAERTDLHQLESVMAQYGMEGNPVAQYFSTFLKDYGIDIEDGVWFFDQADYRKFKQEIEGHNQMLEQMGIMPIEITRTPLRQKRYTYYRATISRNAIQDISKSVSQERFATQAITFEYSETDQMYCGLVRHMKSPQRLLNQTISDIQTYIRTNPRGGVILEEGATDDMEGFAETYTFGQDVTFVSSGALSGGKLMPKPVSPLAQGVLEMLSYCGDAIMQAAGVTPEFMGQMTSKDMTGVLQAQVIRQTLTMLAEFQDAMGQHIKEQARLFVDFLRVLAENEDGRSLRAAGDDEPVELLYDKMLLEYDVEVSESAQLPNEKRRTYEMLWDYAMKVMQAGGNAVPIAMVALEYSDFDKDKRQQILQAMQPPPPDPEEQAVQRNLIIGQTQDLFASARKKTADAIKVENEVGFTPSREQAELADIVAGTALTRAKTMSELSNGGNNGRA